MFPKGMNMQNVMQQAQKMQEKLAKAQGDLKNLRVEGQSGGGMVKVVANGDREVVSIKIEPDLLEDDIDMVEDMILVAVNDAISNAAKESEKQLSAATNGMMGNMKLPGF